MATCSAMYGAEQVTRTQTLAVLPDVLRPRVHRNSPKGVAWTARHQDFVHRARQPLGRGRREKALGEPFPADGVL